MNFFEKNQLGFLSTNTANAQSAKNINDKAKNVFYSF